jgi:hypothetical protein
MATGETEISEEQATMKPINRADITDLEEIPNVGPSLADKLRLIGVSSPQDLLGKDPYTMHEDLCQTTGVRHDPCVIDVFIAAVHARTVQLMMTITPHTMSRNSPGARSRTSPRMTLGKNHTRPANPMPPTAANTIAKNIDHRERSRIIVPCGMLWMYHTRHATLAVQTKG